MIHPLKALPFTALPSPDLSFPFHCGKERGWDGWMASLAQWTGVWVNSGGWWWTGRPGMLQSMGSPRVRHLWVTELNWTSIVGAVPQFLVFLMLTMYSLLNWYFFLRAVEEECFPHYTFQMHMLWRENADRKQSKTKKLSSIRSKLDTGNRVKSDSLRSVLGHQLQLILEKQWFELHRGFSNFFKTKSYSTS